MKTKTKPTKSFLKSVKQPSNRKSSTRVRFIFRFITMELSLLLLLLLCFYTSSSTSTFFFFSVNCCYCCIFVCFSSVTSSKLECESEHNTHCRASWLARYLSLFIPSVCVGVRVQLDTQKHTHQPKLLGYSYYLLNEQTNSSHTKQTSKWSYSIYENA